MAMNGFEDKNECTYGKTISAGLARAACGPILFIFGVSPLQLHYSISFIG